jgi:exoribonuclease R
MSNVNKRHRMAQQAGRASVEFYVGLALKGRSQKEGNVVEVREEAFVIRCFRNGVAVYVHKCVSILTSNLALSTLTQRSSVLLQAWN